MKSGRLKRMSATRHESGRGLALESSDTTEQQSFASYRGMVTGGKPIPCLECCNAGVMDSPMIYQGVEMSAEEFDFGDYRARVPFDVWECRQGHRYTDGY